MHLAAIVLTSVRVESGVGVFHTKDTHQCQFKLPEGGLCQKSDRGGKDCQESAGQTGKKQQKCAFR